MGYNNAMGGVRKLTVAEIRARFDVDVERFSNLETGQRAVVDAALMMELMTDSAAAVSPDAKAMLDIGCGAGNNTLKMLQRINPVDCDLIDLSLPMLTRAKERVSEVNSGVVRVFQEDFRTAPLEREHYDIIIAAAVLHHLRDDADWQMAFQKIFDITAPGGSVWVSDLVAHEHGVIQKLALERWRAYLRSFISEEQEEKNFRQMEQEDSPRSIPFQLELLRAVGFTQIDVLHKNSCFAAFAAIKGAA